MKQYALSLLFVLTLYTPSVAADYVWIGGAGNWNDPNHWSLTSGGPGEACIPSSTDNIFSSNNPKEGWPGTVRSRQAFEGVYVYMLRFQFEDQGETFVQNLVGDMSLIR